MYVDKRLSGVMAVQTLSRLNRTCPGKENTFVLDFVNKPDEILDSFKPYYRAAQLEDVTDPNIVHELQTKLDKAGVYTRSEVEQLAQAFFDPKRKQATLHTYLKPAADRFHALEEDEEEKAEQFRKDLGTFLRMYDFLSQIVPYNDADLERLYTFGKNLMPRIAARGEGSSVLELDSDVRLTHYRLQKLGEQQLDLASGDVVKLKPASEAGSGQALTEEQVRLAEIVGKMNDLLSGQITEADFIGAVTTWQGHLATNERLEAQARNNSEEQFAMGDFKEAFAEVVIEAQEAHNQIAEQLLKDERIFGVIQMMVAKMVWQGFQQGPSSPS
jgi:type I restriction enzyme R subunit